MNKIVDKMIRERNGNYSHCIEAENTYTIESIIETLTSEFISDGFGKDDIVEFFTSMAVYAYCENEELTDDQEQEIYNFNIEEFTTEIYEELI